MYNKPIFYDPANRRWKKIKATVLSFGFSLGLLFGLFIFSLCYFPDYHARVLQMIANTITQFKAHDYQIMILFKSFYASSLGTGLSTWQMIMSQCIFTLVSVGTLSFIGLIAFCLIYSLIQIIVLLILVTIQHMTTRSKPYTYQNQYSVAVVIPAYNEAKVILATIEPLLAAVHPKQFEVIVVDDGSSDDTLSLLQAHYSHHPIVKVLHQTNQGKSAALNHAVRNTNADIIITLDADTIVSKMAIMELTHYFSNQQVGAVAGNIKVGNRNNALTKMQANEYILNHNLLRRAFSILNGLMIVAGATGAWRRDLILQKGGFPTDTLAEDEDLTLKIRKQGYTIEFADKAITYTEAPETLKLYLKQRYRWVFGGLQAMWKHRDILFRSQYGWLGLFVFPNTIIGTLLVPIIGPMMDLVFLALVSVLLFNHVYYPTDHELIKLVTMVKYYLFFLILELIQGIIAFLFENNEDKTLLLWMIPQKLFSRWMLFYITLKAVLAALKGQAVGWNKFKRTATVDVASFEK